VEKVRRAIERIGDECQLRGFDLRGHLLREQYRLGMPLRHDELNGSLGVAIHFSDEVGRTFDLPMHLRQGFGAESNDVGCADRGGDARGEERTSIDVASLRT
jgi:hypothetical protein